jgi:diadenosine tetraphosphate (Ap4A) HIT family hydrolase
LDHTGSDGGRCRGATGYPDAAARTNESVGLTSWPADWEDLRRGTSCPACEEGRPDRVPSGERIFAGATSDAYLNRAVAARGYTLVFWRGRHASELTDLRPDELSSFTRELVAVCRAIEAYYQPMKLNILALGNSLPHLHAHVVPRYREDPNPGRPPRFMMEDREWPLIEEADYRSQLRALRDLLRP